MKAPGFNPAYSSANGTGYARQMYRYRIRPGYGSDKLLVEFMHDSSCKDFTDALLSVFSTNGVKAKHKRDLVFLYIVIMDSPVGEFELDYDEWDSIWVHAEDNQDAIIFIDRILAESALFQKEEVDFKDYTLPKSRRINK
ncbi:MAG: hypothetical protein JXM70_15030 [Pirellulales bacterium]|nr:hypothetical protein [Pirellulales bacterium]